MGLNHKAYYEKGNTDWTIDAVCRDMDPNIFFPDEARGVIAAQKICENCPVQDDCLEFALDNKIDQGVWGGASERARRRMLSRRRRLGRMATDLGA